MNNNSPANFDSPDFAEKWEAHCAAMQSPNPSIQLLARAFQQDAYEAFDEWQKDPSFEFPSHFLLALRIEEREAVVKTAEVRASLKHRKGFVVPATDSRGRNGWFPIGQPSTFIGFSGTGKTKLILQMLNAMRKGEKFLDDRQVPQRSVLWIQQDRGLEQLHDSLEDLFNSRKPWFDCVPPIQASDSAAIERIGQLLLEHNYPEVCIVDGLDILLSDTRGPAVKELFPRLQRVTESFGCALIGTWGSPKRQATKDSYSEVRLAASGASEIGRLSATAALVTRDKDHDKARKLTVATRRSDDDVYQLMFREDGWLGLFDPIALAKLKVGDSKDPVAILQAHGLDWSDVEDTFENGISRRGWFRKKSGTPK